jgi:hypothetical protein
MVREVLTGVACATPAMRSEAATTSAKVGRFSSLMMDSLMD